MVFSLRKKFFLGIAPLWMFLFVSLPVHADFSLIHKTGMYDALQENGMQAVHTETQILYAKPGEWVYLYRAGSACNPSVESITVTRSCEASDNNDIKSLTINDNFFILTILVLALTLALTVYVIVKLRRWSREGTLSEPISADVS